MKTGLPPRLSEIADIHIGRVYDPRDPEGEVFYETFARLASFFGRSTPAHRHQSFYQIHLLTRGAIHIDIDGAAYSAAAPLVILTPPGMPHSFYSDDDTDGHVLTLRQDLVRDWLRDPACPWPDGLMRDHAFLAIGDAAGASAADFTRLDGIARLLGEEANASELGRGALMRALAQAFVLTLARLLTGNRSASRPEQARASDVALFLKFSDLVEESFRAHRTLKDYASRLAMSEARLHDICRRTSGLPPKEIVHDRLTQEAKRLLRFTDVPVTEISYQLGFVDPSYFSRFFAKRTGISPRQFREEVKA